MKTVVETFVIEETEELIYDNEKLQKWNERVEELKLAGQTRVVKPDKSPIPFMFMNSALLNVFDELCPRHVSVEEYDKTPIPVEVLDLIALSVRENYFKEVQVWFDDKTPDPVVIGMTGDWHEMAYYDNSNKKLVGLKFDSRAQAENAGAKHPFFSNSGNYLIAKWGDVKQSLEELRDRAVKRFTASQSIELRKTIKESQRKLDDLEQEAHERFGS